MRRAQATEEAELRKPLKFSIGSDDDDDNNDNDGNGSDYPTRHLPRRQQADAAPPSLMHMRIIRLLMRIFPRALLGLVVAVLVTAMLPGGWRVGLCAANLLPAPALRRGENITLIAHRGCEFPYPENTLKALQYGASLTGFVELDVVLTSDGEVVAMHDNTLDRTTNGTGVTCTKPLAYLQSLEVKVPTRDPRGRIAQGKMCSETSARGHSVPCEYRVPTLGQVFDDLPDGTRFMVDVKECYAAGIHATSPLCSNCTTLMERIKVVMEENFVKPEQIVFTSTEPASLKVFQDGMREGSSFALGVNQKYTHYKKRTFLRGIRESNFTAAAMYIGLAAVRPDLVKAVRNSAVNGTMRHRSVYVWTVRRQMDFRLARCSGASNLIVAEPQRMLKHVAWNVGSLLAEDEFP